MSSFPDSCFVGHGGKGSKKIFVDIGANIGSCTLELLLTTDAHIVAFEPSATNLHYLTHTLTRAAQADPSIAGRVVVLPVGAAAKASEERIYLQQGNLGASSIGIPDTRMGVLEVGISGVEHVFLEKIDELFPAGLGNVGLIKMDVQGYECGVLQGMPKLLASGLVETVTLEVDDSKMLPHNCTGGMLFDLLREARAFGKLELENTMTEATLIARV